MSKRAITPSVYIGFHGDGMPPVLVTPPSEAVWNPTDEIMNVTAKRWKEKSK